MAPEQDDFDPTQSWAALRLQSHVMQKGVQVGSVLGVLFSGAALAYRRKMDTALLFKSPCYGAAIGGILTGKQLKVIALTYLPHLHCQLLVTC